MGTTTTPKPLFTFTVECEETGTCYVPNVFGDNLRALLAALDWARVFNTSPTNMNPTYKEVALQNELEAAATAAEALAGQCREYAEKSREQAERA